MIQLLAGVLTAVAAAAAPAGTSSPVVFAPGVVSTEYDDAHVTFSPDGRSLYFVRSAADFSHWTVMVAERRGAGWTKPRVAPFSGRWSDGDVAYSPDGKRRYFISRRPVGAQAQQRPDTEIWVMERTGDTWGAPRHVAELGSPGDEWYPTFAEDGTVYFGSDRPGAKGGSDLWRAKWLGDRFAPPENLGDAVNTDKAEIEALVAPDQSWVIFSGRDRPEGKGTYDLYVTYRCEGAWTKPVPLGAGVNSPAWEFGPRLSLDGRTLYFTSNRTRFIDAPARARTAEELERALSAPGNGLRDVYAIEVAALVLEPPCGGRGDQARP